MANVSVPAHLAAVVQNARAVAAQGDVRSAAAMLDQAIEAGTTVLGTDDPEILAASRLLARLQTDLGDLAEARRTLEEALHNGDRRLGESHPVMLSLAHDLAFISDELGNVYEAKRRYGQVARLGPAALGPDHEYVRAAGRYLGTEPPSPAGAGRTGPDDGGPSHDESWENGQEPVSPAVPVSPPPPEYGVYVPEPRPAYRRQPPATWAPRQEQDRPANQPPTTDAEQFGAQSFGAQSFGAAESSAQRPYAPDPPIYAPGTPEPVSPPPDQAPPDHGSPDHGSPDHGSPDQDSAEQGQWSAYVPPPFRPQPPAQQPPYGPAPPAPATPYGPAPSDGPAPLSRSGLQRFDYDQQAYRPLPVQRIPPPPPAYPDPEDDHRSSRVPLLMLVVIAVLALAGGGVAAWVAFNAAGPGGPTAGPSAAPTTQASPTPAPAGPPTGLKLRDDGNAVTLTWVDPSSGTVPFIIAEGQANAGLRNLATLTPGTTTYTVNGLNPRLNHCFAVAAVYDVNRVALSDLVCTQRPTSPSPSR